MPNFPNSILALATTLERGWESYRLRGEFDLFVELLQALHRALVEVAENNVEVILPGFTHLKWPSPSALPTTCWPMSKCLSAMPSACWMCASA